MTPRERGLAAWREKRYADAHDAARAWIAAEPSSAQAHQLAAQAAARLGDAAGAAAGYETAEALGGGPACAFNAGNAWKAAGDTSRAVAAWRRAAASATALGPHATALAKALAAAGDVEHAGRTLAAIVRADAGAFDAMQALVDLARDDRAHARSPLPFAPPGDRAPPRSFSFVVCSVDAAKFKAVSGTIAARFARHDHEVIRVNDAASLCEGYTRGLMRTQGDAVVFCHDDIDLLAPDAADRLARHLTRCDLVGVAGTTRVTGPAVFWSGHPHLHGWMTHRLPGETEYEVSFSSLATPSVDGIEAVDGVLMACRRDVALAVGFDAATFDGFHLYDLDFSYRAHLAGRALSVACDLGIVHASKGRFDPAWERYAKRFREKYAALGGERGAPHWYAARVPAAADVLRVQRRLAELAA